MNLIFADTSYWIAIISKNDQWHKTARKAKESLDKKTILVTTDEVLSEFLNHFSSQYGPFYRQKAVEIMYTILENPNVKVVAQSRDSFLKGAKLYKEREDKGYSLVDCISMNTMKAMSITQILTCDPHFTQEGLTILIKEAETGKLL